MTRKQPGPGRRLLVVSLLPGGGGAEGYATTIAVGAASAGWKVAVAAPDTALMRPALGRMRQVGVRHVTVRAPTGGDRKAHVLAALQFGLALVRVRPEVALLVLPWPRYALPEWFMCAAVALPTVVVFQLVPEDSESLRRQIERRARLYRWAAGRRQTWIAVSEHARAVVSELFDLPSELIRCIHNGVRVDDNMPAHASGREIRAELGLQEEDFVILSVGRLVPQKGHVDLLRAVASIAGRYPSLRVVIAGDGPEWTRLEELSSSLGIGDRTLFLGHVADPERLHRVADLFAFPSLYEGTPFAMLEAMARGVCVVAASFGGAEEVIDAGHDGLLVPRGEPMPLAAAIESLLENPSMRLSVAAAGRTKAQVFSEDAMVDQTLAVLEQAVL